MRRKALLIDLGIQVCSLNYLLFVVILLYLHLCPLLVGVDLEREETTLNGADDLVTTLEPRVDGPGTVELSSTTLVIILGVDVEEGKLLKLGASGVSSDGANINDTETRAVVGLVGDAVNDVLVVVDGSDRALVDTLEDRLGQVDSVDDVGGGVLVRSRAGLLLLVKLIVKEDVALVGISPPSLVSVRGAVVAGARELLRHGTVGDVNNGEGVLVVVEANLLASVALVRAVVDAALSIVDVAVLGDTANILGLAGVGDVEHPETGLARSAAGSTDNTNQVGVGVGDDVVAAAEGGNVGSQVRVDVEGLRVLGVEGEDLLEIKDLETVARGLGSNVGVVTDDLDITPDDVLSDLVGQASEVRKVAVLEDFNESSTVSLTDKSELAVTRGPSPDIVALTNLAAHVLVAQETLEVNVAAGVWSSVAVDAVSGLLGRVGILSENTSSLLGLVVLKLLGHEALHVHSIGGAGSSELIGTPDLLAGLGSDAANQAGSEQ